MIKEDVYYWNLNRIRELGQFLDSDPNLSLEDQHKIEARILELEFECRALEEQPLSELLKDATITEEIVQSKINR